MKHLHRSTLRASAPHLTPGWRPFFVCTPCRTAGGQTAVPPPHPFRILWYPPDWQPGSAFRTSWHWTLSGWRRIHFLRPWEEGLWLCGLPRPLRNRWHARGASRVAFLRRLGGGCPWSPQQMTWTPRPSSQSRRFPEWGGALCRPRPRWSHGERISVPSFQASSPFGRSSGRRISRDKSDTLWNINLNVPTCSMKGVLMLFEDVAAQRPFARNTESFYNPKITKVEVTIEGIPNQLFSQGMHAYQMWDEARKLFAGKATPRRQWWQKTWAWMPLACISLAGRWVGVKTRGFLVRTSSIARMVLPLPPPPFR